MARCASAAWARVNFCGGGGLGGGRDIVRQRRPGKIERALLGEDRSVERRQGPGGVAEADEEAEGRERIKGGQEGIAADRVVDDGYALAAGDLTHAARNVFRARYD